MADVGWRVSDEAAGAQAIPLCLVTGFLGSGKTSFLRALSRRHAGRRLVYLVNDFAAVDVDARLLRDLGPDVVSLPGGSIFCRCLVTGFMGALRRIAEEIHRPESPVEGVVVEASGMADPRAVGELLQETRLEERFALSSVIALVDPGSFHKLLQTLPAVRAQVEAADLALVNKSDLHTPEELAATEAALRALQPGLAVRRCVRGEAEVELFQGTSRALRVPGELAGCRDPHFLSAVVRFRRGQRLESQALLDLLARYAGELLRVKGFLPTAGGLVQVEWTVGSVELCPAPPRVRLAALVVIARGGAGEALDALCRALSAGSGPAL